MASSGTFDRILITGGCGYIGAQLVRLLLLADAFQHAQVTILDNFSTENYRALFDLPGRGRVTVVDADILDREALSIAMEGVSSVVHLAGIVNAPLSFSQPELTREVNFFGTKNVVELCERHAVSTLLYASTAGVYGTTDAEVREDFPCMGKSPYADTKLEGEQLLLAHCRHAGLRGVVLRLATVFGCSPAIRFHTVLNRFVFQASIGQALTVYGNGEQVRPFVHVRDAARAFCHSLHDPRIRGIYNVCSENASVLSLVEEIRKWRAGTRIAFTNRAILNQVSYAVDNRKFLETGFRYDHTIREGVEELMQKFSAVHAVPQGLCQDV